MRAARFPYTSYSSACMPSFLYEEYNAIFVLFMNRNRTILDQSCCSMSTMGGKQTHREQGVKNGKKFHHQKAERRTCSEELCRREPAAWGIPLHGGKASFSSQKKEIRFMSPQASLGCKHVQSCSFSAGFRLSDKIQWHIFFTYRMVENTDSVGE